MRLARQFLEAVDKPPARVTRGDVEKYLLGLLDAGRCMRTRNVALASIRCLLHATTQRDVTVGIPHGKVKDRLVTVLTGPEIERVLAATQSAKYRAIFMLAYGAGLRIGEVCALHIGDIDSQRGLIHVRAGKTGERYVPLGKRVLALLRDYWKAHRPPGPELFPGRGPVPQLGQEGARQGGARGRHRQARNAAHLPPHLRDPSARQRRRRAQRAGDARPSLDQEHGPLSPREPSAPCRAAEPARSARYGAR